MSTRTYERPSPRQVEIDLSGEPEAIQMAVAALKPIYDTLLIVTIDDTHLTLTTLHRCGRCSPPCEDVDESSVSIEAIQVAYEEAASGPPTSTGEVYRSEYRFRAALDRERQRIAAEEDQHELERILQEAAVARRRQYEALKAEFKGGDR